MSDSLGDLIATGLAHVGDSPAAALLRYAAPNREPPRPRRVFVNRTLRMETIRYIGFDLDWTLAAYHRVPIQQLTFERALERLVERRGYPEVIRSAEFRPDFTQRGLLIDKLAGTVLKMDRHRYVGRAYLGRHRLDPDERNRLYRDERIDLGRARFYYVDTLFDLPEVNLFAELVEIWRRNPEVFRPMSHMQLFQDVRDSVDSLHAETDFKNYILSNLSTFLPKDPELALSLKRLAMNERKLLLITNSEWYYTKGVCSYLFDGVLPGLDSWRDLFDLVVVKAEKPAFFRQKRPFVAIDEHGKRLEEVEVPKWGGVFEGGCLDGLSELLSCVGEQVLYVGDHIYSDIRSTKVSSTWRTALVVSELEEELQQRGELSTSIAHLRVLNAEVADLGRRRDDVRDVLALCAALSGDGVHVASEVEARARRLLDDLRLEHRALRERAASLDEFITRHWNPTWGSVFKQGRSKSLFGGQVDEFACLYTSRVSNFVNYGSHHYFRVMTDPMTHELVD